MTTLRITEKDRLEAEARRIMARQVQARGWDSSKTRAEWLAEVDAALDDWQNAPA